MNTKATTDSIRHYSFLKIILCTIALLAGGGVVWGGDYTWTGGAGNGDWQNSANWDVAGYPSGASDTATFGNYTVTLTNIPGGTAAGTVTINDSGANITLDADLTIGSLVLTAGTLNANGKNINLGGDWTNGGTFVSGGGTQTVTFNGAGAQAIVSGGTSFNNLTVSKTGGTLTASTAVTTAGGFTISNGTFGNGANPVSIGTTYSQSNGTFTQGTGTVGVSGDFIQTAGIFTQNTGVVTLNGATNTVGGTFTKNAGGSMVFSRGGAQSLSAGNKDLGNITVSGGGTVLTVTNQTITFDDVTVGAGAELDMSGAGGVLVVRINSGKTLTNNGTVRVVSTGTNMATLAGNGGTASFTGTDIAWNGQRLTLSSIVYGPGMNLGLGATLILGDGNNSFTDINTGKFDI
jgi:hypothetical protein